MSDAVAINIGGGPAGGGPAAAPAPASAAAAPAAPAGPRTGKYTAWCGQHLVEMSVTFLSVRVCASELVLSHRNLVGSASARYDVYALQV